jgi:hypothetical protein
MKLRIFAVVAATVIAFGSPVEAKGPSALMITGVGVDRPIVLANDSPVWSRLVNESAFFDAMLSTNDTFGALAFGKTRSSPTPAALGPHLRLTWTVSWDKDHHLVQDLYPGAPGGPLLYTPPDQALYDMETSGGWYRAPSAFVDALESAGVPSSRELRAARVAFYSSLWSYLRPAGSGLVTRW